MNTKLHFCDESRGEKTLKWRGAWLYSSVRLPESRKEPFILKEPTTGPSKDIASAASRRGCRGV